MEMINPLNHNLISHIFSVALGLNCITVTVIGNTHVVDG